ncbi:RHS repeat domain-containing protein [Fulvivirga sp. M361]|uniref:RHS repeat domain-containing protein n=1 Tax=Fulvivirga sp. M361 TaxID=2594266 RepID=UPI001625B972|nr:RHS repeat-associated core domain-containing protein [Fulvivirga sp. M361]
MNYVFDAAGNITEQVDNAQQTIFFNNAQVDPHGKYTYDALYRLLKAEGRELIGLNSAPGPGDININPLPENTQALRRYTQEYEYDEIGNILKMIHQATGGNWTRHYHYNFEQNNYLLSTSPDNNQPTTDQYTYDTHGSMLSMPHLNSLNWDFADRLQTADLGGGGMAYYVYDAGGKRIRKVIERNGGIKEERFYFGGWEVFRKSINNVLDTERESLHILDDQKRIAIIDTLTIDAQNSVPAPQNQIRYQLENHLGSASLELDDLASIISYEEYHPFGTSSYRSGRNSAETSLKQYRYVGKEHDEESGLYYYGARYYASWLIRFVSVDPLKDEYPYYTPYQYAGNKPITFIDLDGLQEIKPEDAARMKRNFDKLSKEKRQQLLQSLDSVQQDLQSIKGELGSIKSSAEKISENQVGAFFKELGKLAVIGIFSVLAAVNDNPNHAGFSSRPKPITQEQIERQKLREQNLLNPKKVLENTIRSGFDAGENLVEGVSEGDGRKVARAVPFIAEVAGGVKAFIRPDAGDLAKKVDDIALSRADRLSNTLGQEKFKKLTGPDPDNPNRSFESILDEVEQGVASQKSGIIDEIKDRAPGNTGADFIDISGQLLDVKTASLDLISSPKKINKLVGKLKADPNLKIGLDPRSISDIDLNKIIDAFKGTGIEGQIRVINRKSF